MNRYFIDHWTTAALGFLVGVLVAASLAPGNLVLLMGVGIFFGFSAWALLDQEFGGTWFWPSRRSVKQHAESPHAREPHSPIRATPTKHVWIDETKRLKPSPLRLALAAHPKFHLNKSRTAGPNRHHGGDR